MIIPTIENAPPMNIPTMVMLAAFVFLLGSCIGSFLNVVIWRLPHRGTPHTFRGRTAPLSLAWPPSHCPHCLHAIPFYFNIPVLAWLLLRGRCAKCHAPIAVRYPLVELGTGIIFAALFLAYAQLSPDPCWWGQRFAMGLDWPPALKPGPAHIGWLVLLLHLFLVGCLLAAAAIDADWFIIPLEIPHLLAVIGILAVTLIPNPAPNSIQGAILVPPPNYIVTFLDPSGPWAWPTLGAAAGLIIALLLLWRGLIPQSFPDNPATHEHPAAPVSAKAQGNNDKHSTSPSESAPKQAESLPPPPGLLHTWPSLAVTILLLTGVAAGWWFLIPKFAALATLIAGLLIFLLGVLRRDAGAPDATAEVMEEISTPHVRREVLKELLFLAFPIFGAILASFLPPNLPQYPWLGRLLGSLLGFLAGGGIVWLTRIFGTLGFGREAMGLGDVHLMYAVGAIIGAPMAILVFLVFAPVLGLLWAAVLLAFRKPNILPYGPWLAVGTILALLLGHPLLDYYLAMFQ